MMRNIEKKQTLTFNQRAVKVGPRLLNSIVGSLELEGDGLGDGLVIGLIRDSLFASSYSALHRKCSPATDRLMSALIPHPHIDEKTNRHPNNLCCRPSFHANRRIAATQHFYARRSLAG